MLRYNNAHYGSDPICSGSEGIAKGSQVPRNTKGQPDVQQLQALCSSELVPDRRWNDQPERLVHGLSEGVATFRLTDTQNAGDTFLAGPTLAQRINLAAILILYSPVLAHRQPLTI